MKYFFSVIAFIIFSKNVIGQPPKDLTNSLKKKALIIGVSKYIHARSLSNPVNDAKDVGIELRRLHFDTTVCFNLNINSMREKITAWSKDIKNGCDIALFYFAGHGAQFEGDNFIFPTDGDAVSKTELKNSTYRMSDIQYLMNESPAKLNIIILDACRDDEGLMSIRRTIFSKGLTTMTPKGNGMLICYSTEAGKTSSDGKINSHSEYTEALLQYIGIPNLPILSILERVHDEIYNKRELDQNPCIYSSVGSEFNYCLSVSDDGLHKSAVKEEAELVDSFKSTQVRGSTRDRDKMFGGTIEKFDSVVNAATQAVSDSLRPENVSFNGTGKGADFDNYTYGISRGLQTRFSNKQVVWVSFELEMIGSIIRVKMFSDDGRFVGVDDPLKKFEESHNLLSSDTLEYSAYAINWREFADHITRYYLARAAVIKR